MKNVLALALLAFSLSTLCTAQSQAPKTLSFNPEQVRRVEILYFPERVLVRAALSPEKLEELYQYKIEIRNVSETAEGRRLLPLLHDTLVEPSGRSYDHRTAVLVFDENGRRVASVYLGQFGNGGTIDGVSGTVKGGVYQWARSLLKGIAE